MSSTDIAKLEVSEKRKNRSISKMSLYRERKEKGGGLGAGKGGHSLEDESTREAMSWRYKA